MENYRATIVRIQKTVPATLYHYCPTGKLRYLLEPGADLNLRYLSYQGNRTEYRFGARLLCDYIRGKGSRYRPVGDVIESRLVDNIGCVGQKTLASTIPLTFSLTERCDSAYHYEEYCQGNGGAIAFNQALLEQACDAVKTERALRLIRCYYEGLNKTEIDAICDAFWLDQFENVERLVDSCYQDEEAGRRVLVAICMIAPHFKRRKFSNDNEWRIVMVASGLEGIDDDGFRASGVRDCTLHGDLVDLMTGVVVPRSETQINVMKELSRFALQQRNRDFKIWV